MSRSATLGLAVGLFCLAPPMAVAESCNDLFQQLNADHIQIVRSAPPLAKGPRSDALHSLESQLFETLSLCPKEADLFALMGEVQVSLGQLPLAMAYGRKSVELNERSWRGQQLLGSSLAMLGQTQEGLSHLERAVALSPDSPRLQLNLASALVASKSYARAQELCDRLVQSTDPEIAAMAYNLRGQAYLRQGAIREAGHDFAAAEKLGFDPRRNLIDAEILQRSLDSPDDTPSLSKPP